MKKNIYKTTLLVLPLFSILFGTMQTNSANELNVNTGISTYGSNNMYYTTPVFGNSSNLTITLPQGGTVNDRAVIITNHNTGLPMYCIEPSYIGLNNGGGTNSSIEWDNIVNNHPRLRKQINRIMLATQMSIKNEFGVENPINSNNPVAKDMYLAGQFLIWESIGASISNGAKTSIPTHHWNQINEYKTHINNQVNWLNTIPSINEQVFDLSFNHENGQYEIQAYDNNQVLSDKFSQLNGHSFDGINVGITNNTLYIAKPTSVVNPNTNGYQFTNASTLGLMHYKPNVSEIQLIAGGNEIQDAVLETYSDPQAWTFTARMKSGQAEFTKVDQYNRPIEGAKFGLYYDANSNNIVDEGEELYATYTSNADGKVITDKLVDGNYVLKELSAPSGYEYEDIQIPFTINGVDQYINLNEVENTYIEGSIELTKTDNYNTPLDETEFTIYIDVNNNDVLDENTDTEYQVLTTDENGKLALDKIPYGNYIIKETKAKTGYVNAEFVEQFDIVHHKDHIALNNGNPVVNTKIEGSIELTKTDDHGTLLDETEFTIYNDVDNNDVIDEDVDTEYQVITTDETGKLALDKIPYGNYIIKETKAKEGYIQAEYEEQFDIINHMDHIALNNGEALINIKEEGRIELTKVDYDTHMPLAGVEFTIYQDVNENGILDNEDVAVQVGYTDFNGYFLSDYLPVGKYLLAETKALPNYILNQNVISFEITKDTALKPNKILFGTELVNQKMKECNKTVIREVKTGDTLQFEFYFGMIALAVMGLTSLLVVRKRN